MKPEKLFKLTYRQIFGTKPKNYRLIASDDEDYMLTAFFSMGGMIYMLEVYPGWSALSRMNISRYWEVKHD